VSDVAPESALLRQAGAADEAALRELWERAAWLQAEGDLGLWLAALGRTPTWLWRRDGAAQGMLSLDSETFPVVTLRHLALRDIAAQRFFAAVALPQAEEGLRNQHAQWLTVEAGGRWLRDLLVGCGYTVGAQVLSYCHSAQVGPVASQADVTLRAIAPADILALAELDAQAFLSWWQWPAVRLARLLAGGAEGAAMWGLVADEAGQLAGYLLAQPEPPHAVIARLAVCPARQGRGIGTRLLTEALARLAAAGCREVWLSTQEDNLPARRLYERLGFGARGELFSLMVKAL
jgi:ribosomal protein S18 acetylase RimI-like enzyme